ncbi:MAG: hypothetical protein RJA70_3893 [Pseudomonadota bacterium]
MASHPQTPRPVGPTEQSRPGGDRGHPAWAIVLLSAFACSVLVICGVTSPACAADAVVEVGPGASEWLKADVVKRLVQLELSDVDIPEPFEARTRETLRSVYVRVRVAEGSLWVQLWDRGELEGERRVAIQEERHLLPRRVALIAAELARRLAARRVALAVRAQRLASREAKLLRDRRYEWQGTVPSIGGGARVASLGTGDAWLMGTQLHGRVRFGQGPQLSIGLAALTGPTPGVVGAGATQWLEMSVQPAYSWRIHEKSALSVGADVAAAAVHLTGVRAVDGILGQQQTWSSRALLVSAFQYRLSRSSTLEISPELGVVLRRMQVASESGPTSRLGGLWIGLCAGIDLAAF